MTNINDSSQNSVIRVYSGTTYAHAVQQHNQQANRLHNQAEQHLEKPSSRTKKVLKSWFKHQPTDELFCKLRLRALDKYMKAVFADPLKYGSSPFVDMLYLTIDVSESTVKQLHQEAKAYTGELLKKWKSGPSSYLKNNKDKYLRFAMFKNRLDEVITLHWGMSDEIRKHRPNHRLAKVAFNPARFTEEEIVEFFSWLKRVIGSGATQLLKKANVTRTDIAMDLFGIPVHYLLVNHTSAETRNYHLNSASNHLVGTQKLGNPASSHSTIYNKRRKYLDVGPSHVPLFSYKSSNNHLSISRFERVLCPADTVPVSLGNLDKLPYFLKSTQFYSPTLLLRMGTKRRNRVTKYGFAYWFHELNRKQWANSYLMAKKIIDVNHIALGYHQIKVLKALKKLIIHA
ncbi:hypothetical protein [Neiella marina]|nr:hypothetical protein [Neiella marina]